MSATKLAVRLLVAAVALATSLLVLVPLVTLSYWATPQWIDRNLLPPIEAVLGRNISFQEFDLGLDGIHLDGFALSEDPDFPRPYRDFLTAERVAVKLDLTSLFRGKVLIERLDLSGAIITVHRNSTGQLNTDSLLPWYRLHISGYSDSSIAEHVIVERLEVRNATIQYLDEGPGREMPLRVLASKVNIRASHIVANRPFDLQIGGSIQLERAQPIHVRARVTFTPHDAPTKIDAEFDRINIAEIVYGVDPKPLPLASRTTNIPACPFAMPHIDARLRIAKLETLRSVFEQVRISAELRNNRIDGASATADLAGGSVSVNGDLDLTKPGWIYGGNLRIHQSEAARLLSPVWPHGFGTISGAMSCDVHFNSRGTLTKSFLDNLNLSGNVRFTNGRIRNNPMLDGIAKLTGMSEFHDLHIMDSGGNLTVSKRTIYTDRTVVGGPEAKLIFSGRLGFDGALQSRMWAGLHPDKSRKLFSTGMLLPYVRDKDDWTYIPVVLSGNIRRPESSIAPGAVAQTAIHLIPDVTEQLLKGGARTTVKIIKGGAGAIGSLLRGLKHITGLGTGSKENKGSDDKDDTPPPAP